MPQRLKPEVEGRILEAATAAFAAQGYASTSMAGIARAAGVSAGNLYRYFAGKEALFQAVLPASFVTRFEVALEARVATLAALPDIRRLDAPAAARQGELLEFWIAHRLQVVILLDRAQGTDLADYGARFVARLTRAFLARNPQPEPGPFVLERIFDGTRRTLVAILEAHPDPAAIRAAFGLFWRFQLAGLAGFTEGGPDA